MDWWSMVLSAFLPVRTTQAEPPLFPERELGTVDYVFYGIFAVLGTLLAAMVLSTVVRVVHRWRNPPVPVERLQLQSYLEQAESAPVFRVAATTGQGWRIESPDGYHYYPVGSPGPARFDDCRSSGFSQTREGAAFAAIHILYRADPVANRSWEEVVAEQMIGPGSHEIHAGAKEALLYPETPQLLDVGPHRHAYIGWTVPNYTGLRADVRLAGLGLLNDRTLKFELPVTMLWSDDDWKMEFFTRNKLVPVEVPEFRTLAVDYRQAFVVVDSAGAKQSGRTAEGST